MEDRHIAAPQLPIAISQALFVLCRQEKARLPAVLASFELSRMQAQVLHVLSPTEVTPMNTIAKELACDASNITGIADRLQARGLIERRPNPQDRRTTGIGLTPKGITFRRKLLARLFSPSPALLGLSTTEQRELYSLLLKIMDKK